MKTVTSANRAHANIAMYVNRKGYMSRPKACAACPFNSIGLGWVPSEGPPDAAFAFLGEAPGKEEYELGRPFINPQGAGHMLRDAAKVAGVPHTRCVRCAGEGLLRVGAADSGFTEKCPECAGSGAEFRKHVLIGNTICCWPPGNDYSLVPKAAVEHCMRSYWPAEPAERVTVLVGGKALEAVFPGAREISKWRGSLLSK